MKRCSSDEWCTVDICTVLKGRKDAAPELKGITPEGGKDEH